MPDGVRLSARIWLPEDAEDDPVPAILEYIPYRKDDATAVRDAGIHPYFAGHGYASVRVDLRGSGDSEGSSRTSTCRGAGGRRRGHPLACGPAMVHGRGRHDREVLGRLQLAPDRRPRSARAPGRRQRLLDRRPLRGRRPLHRRLRLRLLHALLGLDDAPFNARPPDPAVVGERWRERWLERLERRLASSRRGSGTSAATRSGSRARSARTTARSAARSTWSAAGPTATQRDPALPRRLHGRAEGPDRAVGPPLSARRVPGPAIGFLQECAPLVGPLAQGDRDRDHGRADAAAWMQEGVAAARGLRGAAGPLGGRAGWPPRHRARRFALTPRRARRRAGRPGRARVPRLRRARPRCGTWVAWGSAVDFAPDQRAEDGRSLCFTSAPLDERLELLGFPEATLTLASDQPNACVAARLCDVAPGGASTLVTSGVLNLTHRESHEHPQPLVPGGPVEVTVRLKATSYAFPPGHRSGSRFPHVLAVGLAVARAGHPHATSTGGPSALPLPVRPPRTEDDLLPPFEEPRARRRSRSRPPSPAAGAQRFARPRHGPVGAAADLVYFGSFRISETASSTRSEDATRLPSWRASRSRRRRAPTGRPRSAAAMAHTSGDRLAG